MNNKGITLIELVIYIVLLSLVLLLIGTPFKTMLSSFSSGKKTSALQSETRDVTAMIARDLRNTGLKTYLLSGTPTVVPNTFIEDATDRSSFILKEGDPCDTLTIYKARLDATGNFTGEADTVTYFMQGNVLKRDENGKQIDLAQNVQALQFQFGLLTKNEIIATPFLSESNWTASNGSKSGVNQLTMTVNNRVSTFTYNPTDTISSPMRIQATFNFALSGGFPANLDSAAWIIADTGVIGYEKFKPGAIQSVIMKATRASNQAKFALKVWSNTVPGTLTLSTLEFIQADRGQFEWTYSPEVKDKQHVKAIKTFVLLRTDTQVDTKQSGSIAVGNISVSRSGHEKNAWRMFTETVEVPNNGLF